MLCVPHCEFHAGVSRCPSKLRWAPAPSQGAGTYGSSTLCAPCIYPASHPPGIDLGYPYLSQITTIYCLITKAIMIKILNTLYDGPKHYHIILTYICMLVLIIKDKAWVVRYHSRFIPEEVAKVSQILLRIAHVLPKLLSCEEYCRHDKW
jgi:hypothetical protein